MPMLADNTVRTHVLWDSILLEAADVRARFFQIPRGQAGKTKYHTNMVQAGQVPRGKTFEVLAIGWGFEPDTTALLAIALSKGHWELNVTDKVWAEGDMFFTPGGSNLHITTEPGALGVVVMPSAGFPTANNLWSLEYGITLGENESFSVDVEWPAAPTAVKMFFMLYGKERRATN